MPVYDKRCSVCGRIELDVLEPVHEPQWPCDSTLQTCQGVMERAWLPGTSVGVIGDEIDVWVKHGLCHEDGSPRHFRSRTEMARVAAEKGMENHVVHRGTKDGDKSKHTSRWV